MRSIESALWYVRSLKNFTEIIIVDDCSTDGTVELIKSKYKDEVSLRKIQLIVQDKNRGVCCAKNVGAKAASGDYLVFLDSDDELVRDYSIILSEVLMYSCPPVIFFRCQDSTGGLVGSPLVSAYLNVRKIVNFGTPGECLPVIRKDVFLENMYDEDLRGFEGLSYCRISKESGALVVSDKVARIYYTDLDDRLSMRSAVVSRACEMSKGNRRLLTEFLDVMAVVTLINILLRLSYYSFYCVIKQIGLFVSNKNSQVK